MEVQIFFPAYTTPFIYKFNLLEIEIDPVINNRPIIAVIPHEDNSSYIDSFEPSLIKYGIQADLIHYADLEPNPNVAIVLMGATGQTIQDVLEFYREEMTAFPNAIFLVDVGKNDSLIESIRSSKLPKLIPLNDQIGILVSIMNILKKFKPSEDPFAQQGD